MTHWVVGIDEVGTGAWAGPIAVAAVIVEASWRPSTLVRDSKAFGGRDGEERYLMRRKVLQDLIVPNVRTIVMRLKPVDQSMNHAWKRAVIEVLGEVCRSLGSQDAKRARFVIDGAHRSGVLDDFPLLQVEFMPKADTKVPAVSAASIAAKVQRDQVMLELDKRHPHYGFRRHMGYGTPEHLEALGQYGVIAEHRACAAREVKKARAKVAREATYVRTAVRKSV